MLEGANTLFFPTSEFWTLKKLIQTLSIKEGQNITKKWKNRKKKTKWNDW